MRVVNRTELREFVDSDGWKLYTLKSPKWGDSQMLQQIVVSHAGNQNLATGDLDVSQFPVKEIAELQFSSVVVRIVAPDGAIIEDPVELREMYSNLDTDSGSWVDNCVSQVWSGVQPSDEEKKEPISTEFSPSPENE
jgi:hypothetical protein